MKHLHTTVKKTNNKYTIKEMSICSKCSEEHYDNAGYSQSFYEGICDECNKETFVTDI